MNIERINNSNFDFKCDSNTVVKVFRFLSGFESLNYSDFNYKIKTLIKITNSDLNFIFDFLIAHNFIYVKSDIIYLNLNVSEIILFNLFKKYIFSELYKIELLKKELFDSSRFIVIDDDILIEVNSIPISYRNFFKILENMQFITSYSDLAFKKVLDFSLGEILVNRTLRKISLIEFEKIQQYKKIKGEKAEKYVFEFEKRKLKSSKFFPVIVSYNNVTLGYDIKSFSLEGEEMFIEVKALTDSLTFFWSENEINISKVLKEKYFIYCVEFNAGNPISIFKIIQNPYKLIVVDKGFHFHQVGDLEITL
jgi:hypothetical protein